VQNCPQSYSRSWKGAVLELHENVEVMKKVKRTFLCFMCFMIFIPNSYIYKRIYHSYREFYASPPPYLKLQWRKVYYDTYYPLNIILYYLHIPCAYLDKKITGVDIMLCVNNYNGDKSNYGREYYDN
jgi:hypothetical protein